MRVLLHSKAAPKYVPDEAFTEVLPVTEENVLKALSHYTGEYESDASVSDLQFLLTIPHHSRVDKLIDEALKKAPPAKVKAILRSLKKRGFVAQREEGKGWYLTAQGKTELGLA